MGNIESPEHVFLVSSHNVIVYRLQGGVAPASNRSSEEKQMASVAATSQQAVVPEASGHVIMRTGLTESSSSSKLDLTCASDNAPVFLSYLFLKQNISNGYFLKSGALCFAYKF
jgi:hypothetical protein